MGIDYIKLGKNIKYCRKQKNITQEQLAEALDLSSGFVSQIERGVCRMSFDTLINICDFLECSAGDIINNSQLAYSVPKINDFNPQITDDFYTLYKKLPLREQQLFYHMLKAYLENICISNC